MSCEKNVKMENYLPQWSLQSFIRQFFDKVYILFINLKKTIIENKKFLIVYFVSSAERRILMQERGATHSPD